LECIIQIKALWLCFGSERSVYHHQRTMIGGGGGGSDGSGVLMVVVVRRLKQQRRHQPWSQASEPPNRRTAVKTLSDSL